MRPLRHPEQRREPAEQAPGGKVQILDSKRDAAVLEATTDRRHDVDGLDDEAPAAPLVGGPAIEASVDSRVYDGARPDQPARRLDSREVDVDSETAGRVEPGRQQFRQFLLDCAQIDERIRRKSRARFRRKPQKNFERDIPVARGEGFDDAELNVTGMVRRVHRTAQIDRAHRLVVVLGAATPRERHRDGAGPYSHTGGVPRWSHPSSRTRHMAGRRTVLPHSS